MKKQTTTTEAVLPSFRKKFGTQDNGEERSRSYTYFSTARMGRDSEGCVFLLSSAPGNNLP
jgi:hypothetical protein